MMDHNNIQELLSAYANDELARTQREFVEQHLPGCPGCQSELNEYRWVRSTVGILATVPTEANIKETTMDSIQAIGSQQGAAHSGDVPGDILKKLGLHRLPRPALIMAAIAAVVIIPLALQLTSGGPGAGIASAYAATEALESFRMSGTTVSSFGGSTSEVTFDWEFVAPNRYRGGVTTPEGLLEFVILGDEQYFRSPQGFGAGVTVIDLGSDGYSVFNPIPTRAGTLQILDSLTDVESLADETVDGVSTLHYRGRVDIDRLVDEQAALLDPAAPDYESNVALLDYQRNVKIEVELWLNVDDSSLRQVKLDSEAFMFVSDEDGSRFERSSTFSTFVKFTDHNAPISIQRPVGEDGSLEPGWQVAGSAGPAPTNWIEAR